MLNVKKCQFKFLQTCTATKKALCNFIALLTQNYWNQLKFTHQLRCYGNFILEHACSFWLSRYLRILSKKNRFHRGQFFDFCPARIAFRTTVRRGDLGDLAPGGLFAVDELVVSWGLAAAPILRALREQEMAVAARVAALPPLEERHHRCFQPAIPLK